MQKLNLPEYSLNIRQQNGKPAVYDPFRKKFVRLTPEEWVRQNFIRFLVGEKGYSPNLMVVEALVDVNNNPQRADLIVYNRQGNPVLVAEFKAPEVKVNQQTFDQIARYNMALKVNFLIVSNGVEHYCCQLNYLANSYSFLPEIPQFAEIL